MNKRFLFLIGILLTGCVAPKTPASAPLSPPTATSTAAHLPAPTTTLPPPTLTATSAPAPATIPAARVFAQNGNLYIRRGPNMAYDRVGLLMNGDSAAAIGRDMLSKWVQVQIPDSEATGWVSLMTNYSRLEGDLNSLPAFTFEEWPQPAYIKNCTEHEILVLPNEFHLYSLWTYEKYLNQVQVNPGVYQLKDITLPNAPVYKEIDIREGQTYYIVVNGAGERHNCPADN